MAVSSKRSGSGASIRKKAGRRSFHDNCLLIEGALRDGQDGLVLDRSPLSSMRGVQQLAASEYGAKGTFATVHALRSLLKTAVENVCTVLAPRDAEFLGQLARGKPIAAIARQMGLSRSYLSARYRPRVVAAVTREFFELVASDED